MKKRILSLIFCIALLLGSVPIAAEGTEAKVSATSLTLRPSQYGYVYINASDFADVASIDVEIYYDTSALRLMSHTNGSFLSDALVSVNHDAAAGKISLSIASLDGLTGNGSLQTLYFQALSTAKAGSYPISVAVGDAYSSSLSPLSVKGSDGGVTVNIPQTVTVLNQSLSLSGSSVSYGDTLTATVNNSSYRKLAGATFLFTYDPEIFAVESVTLKPEYATDTAIYSVNTNLLGQVRISYVNTSEISSYTIYSVKLKVVGNLDTTTTLTATAKEAYMADLTAYAEGSASRSVAIQPVAQVPNYPDVSLKNETLTVGEQSKGVLTLEKGVGVAAADFTLTYDPAKLSCLGVAKHPSLSEAGGMIVINPNYQNGTIRFSYLNESDYEGDISLVEITWQPLDGSSHAVITPSATGVYDLNYKKVTLEYIATDDCVYVPNVTPPNCLEGGYTTYTCSCGKSFTDHPTEATGHSYTAVVTPPTCLERGFTTHTCRCGDSYVDSWVDSLGGTHILQDHEGKLPTCTEIGWQPYQTCSRCEYTTYTKIPATGHSHIANVTPPTCLEGGYTTFTCHCGDSYVGDRVAATGHTMGDWTETKIPTCTEYGSRRRDCISCDHYETEQLDYRHSFGPWVPSGDLEYRTCSLCFYTETRQNEYAPDCETITLTPLYGVVENWSGKTWFIVGVGSSSNQTLFDALRSKSYTLKVTVTDETTQKTSVISQYLFNDPNSEFYGDSFLRIAVCEYCIVPVLGHAYTVQFDVYDGQTIIYTGSSDTGAFNTFNADFTANGPILADHSYGDWFEAVAPSCTIGGTKQRNCIYCDHFETDLIPATGHDHKAVVTVPTCTDEGYTTHTCHCGDSYVDSYLPETGHTDADHDLHCDGCGTMLAEMGDINGDGTVDMKDAAMLQRHVLKIDILTDDGVLACADVTGDGIVDMKDAAKLTRYVIKVIDSLN